MTLVPGSGPLNAQLLFVGEGPGKNEEREGRPFVGATGNFVRGIVRRAGLDPDNDVRWNNVMPVRVPIPSNQGARAALIAEWEHHLVEDLDTCTAQIIVACGAVALQRLLGLTSIRNATGGVYELEDGRLVIPCTHPASEMRGKIQAGKLAIDRVITRACNYAQGVLTYAPPTFHVHENPQAEALDKVLSDAQTVVLDTEFDPEEETTFLIGLTVDGKTVLSLSLFFKDTLAVLRKHMMRKDLIKVGHFFQADVKALRWLGIDTCMPTFDTLAAFATLYPDLPCGLTHVARFYLDNVRDWKDMDHRDPLYNGIDVHATWRILEELRQDITDAQMWPLIEDEVMPTLPLLYGLQERGLQVDKERLASLRRQAKDESVQLRASIVELVGGMFNARTQPLEFAILANTQAIDDIKVKTSHTLEKQCEIHTEYTGLRKKKFTTKDDKCTCQKIYNTNISEERRATIASLRSEITKAKNKLKKWDRGFDPDNNDHVRWLLYDKSALGLKPQRSYKTKGLTADATAIAKLMLTKEVRENKETQALLLHIKRVQTLEKKMSTFLFMSKKARGLIDKDYCVHPPYRMHGTGTGRPASGDDAYLSEKGVSETKYNVLNIPGDTRQIYVPHGAM